MTESLGLLGFLSPPWAWTTIEASFGVIAACLPTLAPLRRELKAGTWAGFANNLLNLPGMPREQQKVRHTDARDESQSGSSHHLELCKASQFDSVDSDGI